MMKIITEVASNAKKEVLSKTKWYELLSLWSSKSLLMSQDKFPPWIIFKALDMKASKDFLLHSDTN